MKTVNGLWNKMMTKENIIQSIENAHRGKGKKLKQRKYKLLVFCYEHRYDDAVHRTVRRWIWNFYNTGYYRQYRSPIHIKDGSSGKDREIYPPSVIELIIQHWIVNVLAPVLLPMLDKHTYGSIPGRGAHDAVRYIRKNIREHPEMCRYCVKMDHKKYFKSIPQMKLIHKLEHKIRDKKFMILLRLIIMFLPCMEGLPIGFYTSQLLGVWYLYDSDEYVIQELKHNGVFMAVRWMDDVYFFGPDKESLSHCMYDYIVFTHIYQGLKIKDNYQLFEFSWKDEHGNYHGRFLDAMGYRFYCDKVILRKSIMLAMSRTANRISKKCRISIKDCRIIMSYNGYLKITNTHNFYEVYLKPKVSFGECKCRISRFDRRQHAMENSARLTA